MNPQDDQQIGRVGAPSTDQTRGTISAPTRPAPSQQSAAADLIRGQIGAIYETDVNNIAESPQTETSSTPVSQTPATAQAMNDQPTLQHHGLETAPPAEFDQKPASISTAAPQNATVTRTSVDAADWDQYHSAWQKYYQMYYERYYVNHLHAKQQELSATIGTSSSSAISIQEAGVTPDDAMKELRASIRQKVSESANKVKKSRHFVPIAAGLVVLMIFMFLQYNRIILGAVAAYATPGNSQPQNIIANPLVDVEVSDEPRLIIPKINVDVPVIYGIGPDYASQMKAMEGGVAHFSIPRANAVPGQIGNTVLAGHSSNDVFARGDYKFIFAQNEKLSKGDVIYANYGGKRYTYEITSMEVVMPDEVSRVQMDTTKPMMTLVSCVPLGTAEKRLLVFAEQIFPNPEQATSADQKSEAPQSNTIPGKPAPTLIERLFGAQ